MSLKHLFEERVVFSNENRSITSTQQLNFTISTGSDNSFYCLYESYLVLDCTVTGLTAANDNGAARLICCGQPAGLVANCKATYTYIDPSGSLQTLDIQGENENIGMYRTVIDQLFTSKRVHNQDGGYLEMKYEPNTSNIDNINTDKRIFDNEIVVDTMANAATSATFRIKIPYRNFLPCANVQSFINLKQLEVSMKLLDAADFFKKMFKAGDGTTAVGNFNANNIKINKCSLHNHVWIGDESAINPELRELTDVTISTKSFDITNGSKRFDNNIIINHPVKYLIMYLTDKNNTHSSIKEFNPKYMRVGVSGGGQTSVTNFEGANGPDDALYDMTSYCVNTAREESLLTHESWKNRMKYIVYPLSEMLSQKASNIFELNIIPQAATGFGDVRLHCVFIKDSSSA